jgi:hypothetical protein
MAAASFAFTSSFMIHPSALPRRIAVGFIDLLGASDFTPAAALTRCVPKSKRTSMIGHRIRAEAWTTPGESRLT